MKIHIVGKNSEKVELMKLRILKEGYDYSEENPDLVLSYGGDGMFLICERIFPGIPKILIRDSDVGNMCCDSDVLDLLKKYSEGKFHVEKIQKLKVVYRGRFEFRELVGVNDVVIRNSLPTEAIRFRYRFNGGNWSDVLIGDGVVVATSYGSNKGAYFHSITKKSFSEGMGVAFNNVTYPVDNLFLSEGSKVEIEILRGQGVLVSDNNRDFINLENEDRIEIFLINDFARRVVIDE